MTAADLWPAAVSLAAFVSLAMALKLQREAYNRALEQTAALMQARAQAQRFQQELKDISGVMRGHLGQSLEQRQRQQALETRMMVLESRETGNQALKAAKTRLAEGQSLGPMIQRGTLNASEAHLLSLVHRKRKSAAGG